MEKHYSVSEIAEKLGFSPQTIRKMIRCGRIHAFKPGKGKQAPYRIAESDIQRLVQIKYEEQINSLKGYFKED